MAAEDYTSNCSAFIKTGDGRAGGGAGRVGAGRNGGEGDYRGVDELIPARAQKM